MTDIDPESRIATREERIARRESRPGRKVVRAVQDFLPLIVLTFTVVGALVTFFRKETVRSPTGDAAIAFGFLIALLIIGYLNPQVQHYVQTRSRNRE
jgi:hypothetical protein